MLNMAVRNTAKLIREISKNDNRRIGRFFTKKDTARLMADMFTSERSDVATILDPGAGTGILSAAVCEKLARDGVGDLYLTCYETDPMFLPMLYDNLERIRKKLRHDLNARLYYTVYEENYVVFSKTHYTVTFMGRERDKFDYIIMNPPSCLVSKDSLEAEAAGGVTAAKCDLSLLFLKTAENNLTENGQLVTLLPTAYATSAAAEPYRRELLSNSNIERIHLFCAKTKNPKRLPPQKKNIIIKLKKGKRAPAAVMYSVSTDNGSRENTEMLPPISYGRAVNKDDCSILLVKSRDEIEIINFLDRFPETFASLRLRMRTGLVLESRYPGAFCRSPQKGAVPMLRPSSIENGMIVFRENEKDSFIKPSIPSLVQPNKNMIVIKRVPAKSDDRRLNCAVYLASQLSNYRFISTQNKLTYIEFSDGSEMGAYFLWGLYALLTSTLYDRYISITSKSKQINSKEFSKLPMPPVSYITQIGERLLMLRKTGVRACDSIVNSILHIGEKRSQYDEFSINYDK